MTGIIKNEKRLQIIYKKTTKSIIFQLIQWKCAYNIPTNNTLARNSIQYDYILGKVFKVSI